MEKTKYFRSMHFPFSPGTTSDDRITQDYSFLENKEVVILEKLDGENNSICEGGIYARSHGAYAEKPWNNCIWSIHDRIKHQLGEDNFVFGENMYAPHSITYEKLDAFFYVFGVREDGNFLSWDDICLYAGMLNLPTVPVIKRGVFSDIKSEVEEIVKNPSVFGSIDSAEGKPCTMEGVVVRTVDGFHQNDSDAHLLKWVRKDHVKTDEFWARRWITANRDQRESMRHKLTWEKR